MRDVEHHTPGRLSLEHFSFWIAVGSRILSYFRSQCSLDAYFVLYSLIQFGMTSEIEKAFVIHAKPIDGLITFGFERIGSLGWAGLQRFGTLDVIIINNGKLRKHIHLCTLLWSCVQLQCLTLHFVICLSAKVLEGGGSLSHDRILAFFSEMVWLEGWQIDSWRLFQTLFRWVFFDLAHLNITQCQIGKFIVLISVK